MWQRPESRASGNVVKAFLALAALAVALVVPIGPVRPAAAQAGPGGGGEYTPVVPFRVVDTRAVGNTTIKLNQPVNRQVAGVAGSGIPAANVLAVAMNVTVVAPTGSGYLTVWPTGVPRPYASTHNFRAGQIVPNLVVSGVGPGGQVSFMLSGASQAHLLVDVVGWYGTSGAARGARLIPLAQPARALDTRNGAGTGRVAKVGPGQTITFPVRGVGGVPNSANVTGVVLNIAGTNPTAATFITAWPEGNRPNASNLNLVANQTRPNLAMLKVGSDGRVRLYNQSGSVDLFADIIGYYQTGAGEATYSGRVIPLSAPFRAFDTRDYATRLGPNQKEAWNFQPFVDSLNAGGTTVGPISGIIANFTSTAVTWWSWLTVYPYNGAGAVPNVSALNTVPGDDIPNLQVVGLSKGGTANYIQVYNAAGYLHYLADVTAVILSD